MSFCPSENSGLFCLPWLTCRLLLGSMICLCEFLTQCYLLCFSFRSNWVQGSSCHKFTCRFLSFQIRAHQVCPRDMPCILENVFGHFLLRSVAVSVLSLHVPSPHLIYIWQLLSISSCGSGLQMSPGITRDGGFISFHIIFVALRVTSKRRKKK